MISIAIAGGPGSGKTTILKSLKNEFHTPVVFLDETATGLYDIFPEIHNNVPQHFFQAMVLGSQILVQNVMRENFENAILVSDRGTFDLGAYLPDEEAFYKLTGYSSRRSVKYDLVIYLESPLKYCGQDNNPHRKEDAEAAKEVEKRTREAWENDSSNNHFIVVPATETIHEKAILVASAINEFLGTELFDIEQVR